jgi:branched-chain amino acid transport system ATP-binding protein
MTGGDAVLEVSGLSVSYGVVPAVEDVSFTVRRGSITTIIGSNGAGKTTILKALVGLVPPRQGVVRFQGTELRGSSVNQIVARGIALVPEGRRLFKQMTVRENLMTGAYARRDRTAILADLERVLGYFPALGPRLGARAVDLSGGQQQMVAVARALMSAPRLLLLDEPSIGLAPAVVKTIAAILREIKRNGVDILLVEQNSNMALRLSDYGYVLENGRVVLDAPAPTLLESDMVRRAYLGI